MGASFSSLEKHGGCYNFGFSSRTNRKDPGDVRPEESTVYPTHSACDTCRSNTVVPYSDSCCSRLVSRPSCHCRPLPTQSDRIGSTPANAHRIITTETQVDAFTQLEQLNVRVQQQRQPTQQSHLVHVNHPSTMHAQDELNLSRHQTALQQSQQNLPLQPNSQPQSLHPQTNAPVTQDLISLASPTHIFVTEPELRLLMKSGLIPSCRTIGHRLLVSDDQENWQKVSVLLQRLQTHTSIKELTDTYLVQLRELIRSWSYEQLFGVYLRYEVLTKLHGVEVDAINARPKAPTLEEDLRSLCANCWCYNLQLAYHGAMHGAHSYILASRSKLFAEVLCTLYSLHTGHSQTSAIAPNLTIIIPGTHDPRLPMTTTDPVTHAPTPALQPTNSPDLVPCIVEETPWSSQKSNTTESRNPVNFSTPTDTLYHEVRPKSEPERKFRAFLQDIYCGMKRSNPGNDQHVQCCSPRKSKPDLLCGSVTTTNTSSLLILYEELSRFESTVIDFAGPLAPDCKLVFSSVASPTANPNALHKLCHAGVIAARSHFLRRLLIRRYQLSGASHNGLTTIVLDGSLVQPQFAQTLLHFFYTDQLSLNRLARATPEDQCTTDRKSGLADTIVGSTCHSVVDAHVLWHQNHQLCPTSSCCCQSGSDEDRSVDQYNPDAQIGQTAMPRVNPRKLYPIRFCLACPFCLALILELHPVGQYLEFPRLTEACEDVIVRALRLPYQDSISLGHKEHPIRSWEHRFNHPHCNCTNGSRETQQLMTPLSLAVGLIQWADVTSSARLSPTPSSSDSLNASAAPGTTTTAGPSDTLTDLTDMADARPDSRGAHQNCDELTASTLPMSQAYSDDGATTRYLHRQAMHCLRQHFMLLARSPSVLCRLTSKQLNELLASDFVQAPECEILAALLCWAELRLEYEHGHLGDRRRSTDSSPNSEPGSMSYMTLVASLTEQPWLPCDHRQRHYSRYNPWLLLNTKSNANWTETVDLILNSPGDSTSGSGGGAVSSSDKTSSSSHNPRATTQPRQSKCDLCHLAAAVHSTPHSMEQLAACNLGFGPVDLDDLVRKLHRHGLLDHLRPAYMLSSIPLGLAALILQYQLGTAAGAFSSPLCKQRLASSLSFGLNHADTSGSDAQSSCSTDDNSAPAGKSARFARWFPLLTTSMRLLRPISGQGTQEASSSSLHPLLAAKIGGGPLTDCPACSPAEICAHTVWIRTSSSGETSASPHRVLSCDCHWSLQSSDSSVQKSVEHTHYPSKVGSTTMLDAMSPRLYIPFMDEIRAALIAKAPLPFNRSDLDVLRFASDVNPLDQPRCTCVHLLSSLSGHRTPIHFDASSLAASLGVVYRNRTNPKESAEPVSNDRGNSSPSRTPKHTIDSVSNLSTPQPTEDRVSCCKTQCKEFANCLLNGSQWSTLLTRYEDLVNKLIVNSYGASLLMENKQLARFLRLHALRELGLPDSLDQLFACRINEQFLHQYSLHRPHSSVDIDPLLSSEPNQTERDWLRSTSSPLSRDSAPIFTPAPKSSDLLSTEGQYIHLTDGGTCSDREARSGSATAVKECCVLCPHPLDSTMLSAPTPSNTVSADDAISPLSHQPVGCAACQTSDRTVVTFESKSSPIPTAEALEQFAHPRGKPLITSATSQKRTTTRCVPSPSGDTRNVCSLSGITTTPRCDASLVQYKISSARNTSNWSRVPRTAVTYLNPTVFQATGSFCPDRNFSVKPSKPNDIQNANSNKRKHQHYPIRPLSVHGVRSANNTPRGMRSRMTNCNNVEPECAYCAQMAQRATTGLDPCALSLAVLSDEEIEEPVVVTDRPTNTSIPSESLQIHRGSVQRNYVAAEVTAANYHHHHDNYYYYYTTGSYQRQAIPISPKPPPPPRPTDTESQVGLITSMTSSCSSYQSSSCLSGLSKSLSDVSETN